MENQEKKPLYFYGVQTSNYKNKSITRRVTFAGIQKDDVILIGKAVCSEKDRFVKEKGRNIAVGRANSKTCVDQMIKIKEGERPTDLFVNYAKSQVANIDPQLALQLSK